MDDEKIRYLISQIANEYNRCRETTENLTRRVNSFEGEEFEVAKLVHKEIRSRNLKNSTFLWSIDEFREEEIFEKVKEEYSFRTKNTPPQ